MHIVSSFGVLGFGAVGLIVVERAVVTDREKIENLLAEGADAVSKNDIPRVAQASSQFKSSNGPKSGNDVQATSL